MGLRRSQPLSPDESHILHMYAYTHTGILGDVLWLPGVINWYVHIKDVQEVWLDRVCAQLSIGEEKAEFLNRFSGKTLG
jgi:hypothetical protein